MESPSDSHKRLKTASGAPITINGRGNSNGRGAAGLPAYQPPPVTALTPRNVGGKSAGTSSRSSASVSRPGEGNKLRLTVKAPPSKLRQATSGSRLSSDSEDHSDSDATPRPAQRSIRSTRNPRTLIDADSDEIDDIADEEERTLDELEQSKGHVTRDDGSDIDAEGDEDDDLDEDEEMDELHEASGPAAAFIQKTNRGRPMVTLSSPIDGPLKSVEDKEMEDADDDDDDDEELSELDSNEDEDENGEENGEEGGGDDEGDEDDEDSDEDMDNSRSATPDLSKLTRRQRGAYEEEKETSLLALSNEAQKKKHFTEEEHAVRRQEMARRRKNLSEKRNEEEKMETINKLLSKPAPKRRTRAEILAAQRAAEIAGTPGDEDGEEESVNPVFTRWVADAQSSRIGMPAEWLRGEVGSIFARTPHDEDTIQVSRRAAPPTGLFVEEVS